MLKVNTDKISVEEFIKKFDMAPLIFCSICPPVKWSIGKQINVYPNGEITVSTEGAGESVQPRNLDILFDMITNGDVIKDGK